MRAHASHHPLHCAFRCFGSKLGCGNPTRCVCMRVLTKQSLGGARAPSRASKTCAETAIVSREDSFDSGGPLGKTRGASVTACWRRRHPAAACAMARAACTRHDATGDLHSTSLRHPCSMTAARAPAGRARLNTRPSSAHCGCSVAQRTPVSCTCPATPTRAKLCVLRACPLRPSACAPRAASLQSGHTRELQSVRLAKSAGGACAGASRAARALPSSTTAQRTYQRGAWCIGAPI
jgi:hypothetical protein